MPRKPMNPDSDNARVLACLSTAALRLGNNGWFDHPYRRLPVMWHSRVAELRRRGYVIESRRVTDADGKPDYQYRLVSSPQELEAQA